jgi:hypothetical protein
MKEELMPGLDWFSFLWGSLFGFSFATLLGMIARRIQIALHGMGAPDRPMTVPTDNHPRHVIQAAAAAFRDLVRWSFMLILIFVVAGVIVYLLFIGNPLDLVESMSR